MQEIDPNKAIQFLIDTAPKFAQAKAHRVFLEEARKSKKASLMNSCDQTVLGKQETYAYSHPEYMELLEGLKVAVEEEEKFKWLMVAAQARIEVFKVQQYTARAELKALN